MRFYYYLLYRIYIVYTVYLKEKSVPLMYVSAVSTILVGGTLYTVYSIFKFLGYLPLIELNWFLGFLALLWIFNYHFLVKPSKFLDYGFKTDKKGGYIIVFCVALSVLAYITVANKNRERIFSERKKARIGYSGHFKNYPLPLDFALMKFDIHKRNKKWTNLTTYIHENQFFS